MKTQVNKQFAKYGKKITKFLVSPFTVGLVVTAAITYVSFLYYGNRSLAMANKDDHSLTALISQIHQKTIDWRLTDRGPISGSDRVAILAVDEKAIEQEGRWPWPRGKQATMIERALGYGAKSVSFDIAYAEADETSAIPTLKRLKRDVSSKPPAAQAEFVPLIESELKTIDGDQAFADMTKAHADHLILGAFFDNDLHISPHQDFCLDALFERTPESRYWKHEQSPITVVDETLNRFKFPPQLREGLQSYMLPLEVAAAQSWFDEHKDLNAKINTELAELGLQFPPETYPGLATLWLNYDVDNAKALLEQAKPEMANEQGVGQLFSSFGTAFSKQETASLKSDLRSGGAKYCERFLNPSDELLNLATYKKMWPSGENVEGQFAEQSWDHVWKEAQKSNSESGREPANVKPESLDEMIDRVKRESFPNSVLNAGDWIVNIPLIAQFTKHTGYFNAKQDSDGTVRRSFLLVRRGNTYMPSLAFKQFLIDNNYHASVKIDAELPDPKRAKRKIVKELAVLDDKEQKVMNIPVDEYGYLMINYAGASEMFPHISAADILTDSPTMDIHVRLKDPKTGQWKVVERNVNKKEFLKDKMLIAGATATGVYDLRVTPFEENYPGVETHANVLSNLTVEAARATLGGRAPASAPGFLRVHPREERSMWVILVVLGVALAGLLSYFGSVAGLGIAGATLGGIYFVDRYVFFNNGIVTTVLFPVFEVGASYVTLTFYKYFTEERKKRELKGTFEKYVSPAIVNEVLADPENIELGGKKMELTVMFSDVRGFTTISEKLDPRQLSDLLNSYLTPMTDLVFKNKGTLDKYMGDAIMAFWGAPIHFQDHAKHACRCALQMIEKLKQLQEEYRAKGLPEIDIGIGLNTGDMSVGNMGSETVRSYTVMGDSVNLGSRLEGINKEYHTRIIISEFTQKEVKDSFVTREVDWVRVKGKAQPVRIFELIAEGPVPPQTTEMLKNFESGFALYHERKFEEAIQAFNEALKIKPNDGVSQLYIARCEDYLKEPPGENWDGVCVMTHK